MASTGFPQIRVIGSAPAQADVVIVGGGIVGAASAFWLARAGLSLVIVEAEGALASRTTANSAHCIRAQFSEPENIAMMGESLDIFERFAEVTGIEGADINLVQQGYLFASTEPGERDAFAQRVARQQALGLADVELLDGDEIRYQYPWMSAEVAVGAYRRRDGWLDGGRVTDLFAAASGAAVLLGALVGRIMVQDGRVTGVETSKGTILAERVVLAAGPFSVALSPETLPLHLLRRNRVLVGADPRIPQNAPMTIDANTGAHWRPHRGGAVLAWAQDEVPGVPVWPVAPDEAFPDLVLRGERGVRRLSPFWDGVAADLETIGMDLRAGQYTMTPDHKPLIGPAPETAGLFINTGYSGHGIMGSASGGRTLTDTMTGQLSAANNPFDPGRFAHGLGVPDVEQIVI